MKQMDLASKTKRKFKVMTDSKHQQPVTKNILNRDFNVTTADTPYVGDITYIHTKAGWLYLAVVIDLFSRQVIG